MRQTPGTRESHGEKVDRQQSPRTMLREPGFVNSIRMSPSSKTFYSQQARISYVASTKRRHFEDEMVSGIVEVGTILTPLDKELADWALVILDIIRTDDTDYADAIHAGSTRQENNPVIEQRFGLRILIEQADLDLLAAVPSS